MTERKQIVVVGGVAGGASAAARARRVDASANIILIERSPDVSFANCGLPYHVGGEIASRDDLLVATPELFRRRLGIDVRTNTEATSINAEAKVVHVKNEDGVEAIAYDKLILSPGAEPRHPPFLDRPLDNVTTLWSLSDMDRVIAEVADKPDARTVVIGGGFVGLEVAEQFAHRGLPCTLIQRGDQVLQTIDAEMAAPLHAALREGGVELRLGADVKAVKTDGDRAVALDLGGEEIAADVIVVAIGVRPRTQLAESANLEIGSSGGVKVDRFMRTSDPDIFAVGDSAEYQHALLGPSLVPLAGPANRSGRIAGTVAAGGASPEMIDVLGTSVVRVFDLTAASTGLNQRQCEAAGLSSRAAYIVAHDHASYFPGAAPVTLKLVYDGDGRILGAQGVGRKGVDKRIDVIATALGHGGTVRTLAGVDLAYAPPFGSAKDPVHMAAFVASNDLDGFPKTLAPNSDLTGYQVVDVRTDKERAELPIHGAENVLAIPIDDLIANADQVDSRLPTVAVCHSGKRAHVAASILQSSGVKDVFNLTGGAMMRSRFF